MKPLLKVILGGLLAAALALGVRWLYRQSADVINGGGSAWYEDKLLEAKELFLEKPDAVLFYTCYAYGGCVGFLYEKELDETHYFEVFEIVENWKLFYKLKK